MWRIISVLIAMPTLASALKCPAFASIAQPSVAEGAFSASELIGEWFLIATNEPTMPPFCRCGMNRFTEIGEPAGTYAYSNTDNCSGVNISIPIKGVLSTDPRTPGLLHENFAPFNSTHTLPLLPNMIFDVQRAGTLEVVFAYACLGWFPIKGSLFSFNIMARRQNWTRAEIDALVDHANKTTHPLLKLSGLRYNDGNAYRECGMFV